MSMQWWWWCSNISTTNLKGTPPIKVFWYQFKVNKLQKNPKPSVTVNVSHASIFLSTSGFLLFLQRGGEEWRNSNRMGEGCWCSCGYFLPLILVEKSLVKLRPSNTTIQVRHEKWHTWRMKQSVSVWVTQFLVNNLFYTWTFIKSEFFRI